MGIKMTGMVLRTGNHQISAMPLMAVLIGFIVWAIAAALLAFGVRRFRRTTLVGKL